MAPGGLQLSPLEQVRTADGSWTLRDVALDVTYRSIHGAATESARVFVESWEPSPRLRILELGLGAAMNFHLTRVRAEALGLELEYVGVDAAPVPSDIVDHDPTTNALVREATSRPGQPARRTGVELTLVAAPWREAEPEAPFDIVYHDPFGPEIDPDPWSIDCFRWSRALVKPGALLLTYSVAGHVRRALEQADWLPEKVPGPPGKREVLRAVAVQA